VSVLAQLGIVALVLGCTFLFDQLLGLLIRMVRPAGPPSRQDDTP
jgi:hypothetical protein